MREEVPVWIEVGELGSGDGRKDSEDVVVALKRPGTDWDWREGGKGRDQEMFVCFTSV